MSAVQTLVRPTFDVERVRQDFPILQRKIRGKPLVYLDNAATAQKPRAVIESLTRFYTEDYSNIHRGVHFLSEAATEAYEAAREKARGFIHAAQAREVVFVRGTTEGINLVASSYGRQHVREGDEVLLTAMEHHSNLVPWQILCQEKGARLQVAPINDRGELLVEEFERLLSPRTRIVAVAHVSNALGTINPVKELARMAHEHGAVVVVDGAQAAPHLQVDVGDLDSDFYAFSGHKMFGPTGIGVLYGKARLLESMPPYEGGGSMITSVSFERTTYAKIPTRFEAGTPNIEGTIGLGAAIDYLESLDREAVEEYESDLLDYGTRRVLEVPGVRIVGTARKKAGVLSFVMEGVHPHDIGTILDQNGIAIRAGHHCAQPLMKRMGVPATCRASVALYNTRQEMDALARGLEKVRDIFG